MSIKFEGKPPFYLGIAELVSAQALDGSVVLRVTISVPELRPKSVPVQFIIATDVAKALAEQLPIAVRMAQTSKAARRLESSVCAQPKTYFVLHAYDYAVYTAMITLSPFSATAISSTRCAIRRCRRRGLRIFGGSEQHARRSTLRNALGPASPPTSPSVGFRETAAVLNARHHASRCSFSGRAGIFVDRYSTAQPRNAQDSPHNSNIKKSISTTS